MSEYSEEIRRAIIAIVDSRIPLVTEWAKVKSIEGKTCTVVIDELEIPGILLGFENSGVIVYPTVNTDVLVLYIAKQKTIGVIVYAEETTKIEIMGNANGGLVNVGPLVDKLNALESDNNELKTILQLWVPVANDGGAALKTASATWASSTLTPTVQADIENTNIEHGNG